MTLAQGILFDPRKLSATDDPATSHAAAKVCRELRADHHHRIVAVLEAASVPLTAEAIAARCSLTMVQAARRMSELRTAGVVVVDGEGFTASGRRAQAYRMAGER